jgi:hypothetical protein
MIIYHQNILKSFNVCGIFLLKFSTKMLISKMNGTLTHNVLQVYLVADLKLQNLNLEQMSIEEQNLNEAQKPQLNIPAVIRSYSDKGIFIEVLADGYKLEDVGICWRGYVYWKQNGEWVEEDCGCYPDWIDAFNSSIKFIHDWVLYNCV